MCGDLDEDTALDNEVHARFVSCARRAGAQSGEPAAGVPDLVDPAGRGSYMQSLFTAGLTRALNDAQGVAEGQRVDAIAAQAIAFARLAGFLAGQLPPEADLYRTALEAFGDGHAEPRRLAEERHAAHAHHGHDHHH